MNEVALGELLVRTVFSLAVVLALVALAYLVMKRRNGGSGAARLAAATALVRPERGAAAGAPRPRRSGAGRAGANRAALRVLGRTGVGRSSNVMAVQFADRVLLVGATDGAAPVLLADVAAAEWELATHGPAGAGETADRAGTAPRPGTGTGGGYGARHHEQSDAVAASLGLIEALRDATARRG